MTVWKCHNQAVQMTGLLSRITPLINLSTGHFRGTPWRTWAISTLTLSLKMSSKRKKSRQHEVNHLGNEGYKRNPSFLPLLQLEDDPAITESTAVKFTSQCSLSARYHMFTVCSVLLALKKNTIREIRSPLQSRLLFVLLPGLHVELASWC